MPVKLGGDPEFFVVNGDGSPRGAFEFFPGTKENPYPLVGGSVQVDGFAVELGIDPSDTAGELNDKVKSLVQQCEHFIPSDHKFVFEPVIRFEPEYFSNVPNVHKVIGCDPSYNLLVGAKDSAPMHLGNSMDRYAGGHVHLGIGEFDSECHVTRSVLNHFAYQMNNISFGNDCDHPLVERRIEEYGSYYSVRYKPYGIELRRPSNHWADPSQEEDRISFFTRLQQRAEQWAA